MSSNAAPALPKAATVLPRGEAPRHRRTWARWNRELDRRYTIGLEDELMLLQPATWSLAESSDEVLALLSEELAVQTSPETHAAVVELTTGVHIDVDAAIDELSALRRRIDGELRTMGLAAAAAGTHPFAVSPHAKVSGAQRYRALERSMRFLARREPTMALHVHIGVPDPEDGVRLLNALRRNTPLLLALSANSPFWQGRDGGFASARTMLFQAFPRTGLPRFFRDYADYVDTVDALIASGAIRDPSLLWWDVRLRPALGTVELRVMDAQSTTGEATPLVALVQSLARLELEDGPSSISAGPEVLAENRFLAARDGMDARLIDPSDLSLVPAPALLDRLLDECRPHAAALGCDEALARVPPLAARNGARRQRAFTAGDADVTHLVADLARRFLSPIDDGGAPLRIPRSTTERNGSCAAGSPIPVLPSS